MTLRGVGATCLRSATRIAENLHRHDAFGVANIIAFDAFLSLVPLLAMAGWVLARLDTPPEVVLGPLLRAAPQAVQGLATDEFFRIGSSGVPPISALVFLYVTSSGMATAMGELERIGGVGKRPWLERRVYAVGWVVLGIPAVAAMGFVGIHVGRVLGARVASMFLPALAVFATLAVFYKLATRKPPRWVWPGTALTLALWLLLSWGYAQYVQRIARYATLYGGLAAVAVSMLWLWLLALAFIIGGELNAEIERVRDDV